MKQGHPRQRRHRRTKSDTVICLPPPKPPLARKRSTAAPALPLSPQDEPLAMTSSQPSRQVRRAALRSGGNAMAHPIPSDDATSPLPRNRSLALSRPGTLARLRGWLRGLLIPARTPDRRRLAASPAAAAQIRALRGDVARLQRSLDRLLDASS